MVFRTTRGVLFVDVKAHACPMQYFFDLWTIEIFIKPESILMLP